MNDFDSVEELAYLRATLATVRRHADRKGRNIDALVAAVYEAASIAARDQGPLPPVPKVTAAKGRSKHIAVLHTTDWQCGKVTADFDAGVLEQRLRQMMDITAALTARHSNPVDHCVILFGGDMLEGITIFPGQAFEVDRGLYDQLFDVVRLLQYVVDAALSMFKTVEVVGKHGNHGRIGKFGELPSTDNLDRMSYRIAANRYEGSKRVKWTHSEDFMQMFTIGAYKGALLHGNEFARTFSAQRIVGKLTAWQTQYEFADAYLGHFHRRDSYGLPNGGMVYLTGSPESSNAYAAEVLAARGRPSQRLHFVDPVRGMVLGEHVLWLDA